MGGIMGGIMGRDVASNLHETARLATTKPWDRGPRKGSSTWLCQSHVDPVHMLGWCLSSCNRTVAGPANLALCWAPSCLPLEVPFAWSLGYYFGFKLVKDVHGCSSFIDVDVVSTCLDIFDAYLIVSA